MTLLATLWRETSAGGMLLFMCPFSLLSLRNVGEKSVLPSAAPTPQRSYNFSPILFAPRKFNAENDNPLPVARISHSQLSPSPVCKHLARDYLSHQIPTLFI